MWEIEIFSKFLFRFVKISKVGQKKSPKIALFLFPFLQIQIIIRIELSFTPSEASTVETVNQKLTKWVSHENRWSSNRILGVHLRYLKNFEKKKIVISRNFIKSEEKFSKFFDLSKNFPKHISPGPPAPPAPRFLTKVCFCFDLNLWFLAFLTFLTLYLKLMTVIMFRV